MAKQTTIKYVSNINDCEAHPNTDYVLVGDAVLGEYFDVNTPVSSIADKAVEYLQPQRALLPLEKRIKNPKFGTSHIHFSLNKEVINKLLDLGISKKRLFIAHDVIMEYIKSRLKKQSCLVICLSQEGAEVCLEQFTVVNGIIVNFKESRIDNYMFSAAFSNYVRKEIRSVAGDIENVKVCGPFLQSRDIETNEKTAEETWDYDAQPDYVVELIKPFGKSKRHIELYTGNGSSYNQYYTSGVLIAIGLMGFFGLDFLGRNNLNAAKADYQQRITGFEQIYSKGSAPIELLQRRNDYLAQQDSDAIRTEKLQRIVKGVAFLQSEQKALEPSIDQIILNDKSRYAIEEAETESEFSVTISFYPKDRTSLEITPILTDSLVRSLGAQIKVTSQPRRYELNGISRLRLTLEGTFCPNFQCRGA